MNVWPLLWGAIEAVDTQLGEQPVAGWLGESAVVGFWQTPKTNEDSSNIRLKHGRADQTRLIPQLARKDQCMARLLRFQQYSRSDYFLANEDDVFTYAYMPMACNILYTLRWT